MRRGATAVALSALLLAVGLTSCSSGDGNDASGPTARAAVTVVAQNLLHGVACPADSDRCKLPQRVQLFARQLTEAGCPQVVSVEEADPVMAGLLRDQAAKVCRGRYRVVGADDPSLDREVILTTLPVLGQERVHLAGPLRTALWVRVKASLGPLDVVATHLASSSDDRPCDTETCPAPCRAGDSLNTCQGREAAQLLGDRSTPESVGVLIGDLNAKPDEPTIRAIVSRGYVDTFVAAHNAACDATTGAGCTSGRQDQDLSDLTNPSSHETERIDYIFLATKRECRVQRPTGLFRPAPETAPLDGLVFASDHTGVQATISCLTTAGDRAAAKRITVSTTSTSKAATIDDATRTAVTKAFETVFNGGGADVETRLTSLQDADRLRDSFIARYEDPAVKSIADRVRVRIDSMEGVDAKHVDVVYSILLDQAAVLDHLPGAAVRVGGRWLVTRRTYCQVATLGQSTVPEPCR
ncbi:MAG: endonuclease/exonuclease/phosphatase family protein [Acidimicrobiia bacterium]